MSITALYDGSFASEPFMELWSDGQSADDYPVDARAEIVKYAGGGHGIKTSGLEPKILELPIAATNSDMDDLEAKADSTGTLVYSRGSSGSWYLKTVRGRRRVGKAGSDVCRAIL